MLWQLALVTLRREQIFLVSQFYGKYTEGAL